MPSTILIKAIGANIQVVKETGALGAYDEYLVKDGADLLVYVHGDQDVIIRESGVKVITTVGIESRGDVASPIENTGD